MVSREITVTKMRGRGYQEVSQYEKYSNSDSWFCAVSVCVRGPVPKFFLFLGKER